MDEQRAGEPSSGPAVSSGAADDAASRERASASAAPPATDGVVAGGSARDDAVEQRPERRTPDAAAPAAVRELAERVEARLAELDNRPVAAHGELYAAIHADLSQALERLDVS